MWLSFVLPHRPNFVDVESSLGGVADDEDEDDSGEDRYHSIVTSMRITGLECSVKGSSTGDGSVDQPVKDREYDHW